MEFGEQIRELRKKNQLSQEQFAKELNVTRQAVSNWENNKNLPDLEMLISMSATFHISLDELILGGENDMNDMTKKLIHDSSETRRAHDNKVTTLVGTFLLIMGFFCFFAKSNSVEYVDADGILHESFWLIPVGYLFLLAGIIVFASVGIRTLRNSLAKKREARK